MLDDYQTLEKEIDTVSPYNIKNNLGEYLISHKCCLKSNEVLILIDENINKTLDNQKQLSLIKYYCKLNEYYYLVDNLYNGMLRTEGKTLVYLSENMLPNFSFKYSKFIDPDYFSAPMNNNVYLFGCEHFDYRIYDPSIMFIPHYLCDMYTKIVFKENFKMTDMLKYFFENEIPHITLDESWCMSPVISKNFYDLDYFNAKARSLKDLTRKQRDKLVDDYARKIKF